MFLDQCLFELSCKCNPLLHTNTHTDTNTDSEEYSIVAFCKNATIILISVWNTLKKATFSAPERTYSSRSNIRFALLQSVIASIAATTACKY